MATWYTLTLNVRFNANGGTGAPATVSNSIQNIKGTGIVSVTIPNTKPTKSGVTFSYWYDSNSGDAYSPGGTISYTFDDSTNYTYTGTGEASASHTIVLTAVWSSGPNPPSSGGSISQIYCKQDGAWKKVTAIYRKIDGTWKSATLYLKNQNTWIH